MLAPSQVALAFPGRVVRPEGGASHIFKIAANGHGEEVNVGVP